jgi:ABC-type antimicrobial peptide transport system permease subunit
VEVIAASGSRPPIRGRVVGVVADRRASRSHAEETVYAPLAVDEGGGGFLIVRGRARGRTRTDGADDLVRRVRDAIAGIDPLVATLDEATYGNDQAETVWVERRLAQLFGLFATASLALAGFGLFGGAVLTLRRRGRELAIRSALGARPAQLRGLLLRQGLRWIGFGLAGGLALAWTTHGLLAAFLHGVGPWDPAVTAGAAVMTVLTLSAGVLGPARGAARTDPAAALDAE